MALEIIERIADDMGWARYRAVDSSSSRAVAVRISSEAMTDRGEAACLGKAKEKYNGAAVSVDVTVGDF